MSQLAVGGAPSSAPFDASAWRRRARTVAQAWPAHLCLAGLAVALAIVGPRHAAWFDEAQAWLIARDASPWTILTTVARHEGSPALWHLLLWTMQRLGLPFHDLWTVSAALSLGGAAVVLYRAPFPLWMRAGAVLGYFTAYQFALVARSYALPVLLLPLAASVRCGPRPRPILYAILLGLIANTSAHAFLLAAALAGQFAWDERRTLLDRRRVEPWLALGVFGALACAAAVQAWPSPDVRFALASRPPDAIWAVLLFKEALIGRPDLLPVAMPAPAADEAGLLLSLLAFAPLALLCLRARLGPALFAGVGALLVFSAVKFADPWHAGLLYVFLVSLLWMAWPARARLSGRENAALLVALGAVLLVQDVGTVRAWRAEFDTPYSGAPAAARALANRLRSDPVAKIMALGARTLAVQPWFAQNIFANHLGGRPERAYYLWSTADTLAEAPSPAAWKSLLQRRPDWLLLGELRRPGAEALPPYAEAAAKAGYRLVDTFPGQARWRGRPLFLDDMYLFGRAGGAAVK
jgi:hypothetical protein